MKQEDLIGYQELKDEDGFKTFFRKFDKGTWIFQFNNEGTLIGQSCLSSDIMAAIQKAPSIKAGDGKTKQTL